MIRYGLICDNGHDFEGWFASASDFDGQQQRGLVECPACGSHAVSKRLMAPSVSTARKKDSRQQLVMHAAKQEMIGKLKEMVTQIRANADDVGERFPEEARKIHYGEVEERAIYGEASSDDVEALLDEGVEVLPLPPDLDGN